VRICYIGDPRSVHTQRWVRWFADRQDVSLIATAPDASLKELELGVLTEGGPPGTRLVRAVRDVRTLLRRARPDVVHAHFINEAGWFAAASGRRPFVVTAWGSDVYRAPQESKLAGRLNPWAVRRADWVTCDSEDQARTLREWAGPDAHVSVIGWGVDRDEFNPEVDGRPMRRELGIPEDVRVVFSPRQWLPNSNIEAVVAAHARLPADVWLLLKRIPRFEDAAGAPVERAVADSPAKDRIRVVGEINADQLAPLTAASDAVVSLCGTDGTPVSLLEAMAVGKPVVALRNASVAEWLSDPGGQLIDDLEPATVAAALETALRPGDARAEARAHNVAVVAERADRAAEMARMEQIYGELTGGGAR
jgi:glycosyltransferase involved in cell wall biosynthesis